MNIDFVFVFCSNHYKPQKARDLLFICLLLVYVHKPVYIYTCLCVCVCAYSITEVKFLFRYCYLVICPKTQFSEL